MFGKNKVIGMAAFDEPLWVQEVFATLQGEGPLAGTPAIFIRMAGCNLRCHFCDTDFESSTWRPSLNDLLAKVHGEARKINSRLAVITGGEPLRQRIGPLIHRLLERGYSVQIETAGTLWSDELEEIASSTFGQGLFSIVCSPKTATVARGIAKWCYDYKYIVRAGEEDPEDGLPQYSTQILSRAHETKLYRPAKDGRTQIWLQPCAEYDHACQEVDPAPTRANIDLAAQLCLKYGYRLSMQIHKLIGLP